MRLLYTGLLPVTFPSHGVSVEPGDAFDVPDDAAASYLARADVEAAPEPVLSKPRRGKSEPTPDPAGDVPAPAVSPEEAGRAVPDNH